LLQGHASTTVPVAVPRTDAASQISVNVGHACALRASGEEVKCWGSNTDYKLGSDDTDDSSETLSLEGARAISAGSAHTCVAAANGRAYCWGRGDLGQLGNGVTPAGNTRTFAATFAGDGLPVFNARGVVDVKAGTSLNCALTETGRVYCWGRESGTNYPGELVRDSDGDPLGDVTALCTGSDHACALREDGTVVCWGSDAADQLGSDSTPDERNEWVLADIEDVTAIAWGSSHTCAVLEDGEAACWGSNMSGELASGDAVPAPTPVPVLLPPGLSARSVFAGSGGLSTCFELTTGQVFCAGHNYYGQLGTGESGSSQNTSLEEITSWP
jgi:alpha-tubulin suppressor-like RCC1 family protein